MDALMIVIPVGVIIVLYLLLKVYNKAFKAGEIKADHKHQEAQLEIEKKHREDQRKYRKEMERLTIDCRSGFDKLVDRLRSLREKNKIKLP